MQFIEQQFIFSKGLFMDSSSSSSSKLNNKIDNGLVKNSDKNNDKKATKLSIEMIPENVSNKKEESPIGGIFSKFFGASHLKIFLFQS